MTVYRWQVMAAIAEQKVIGIVRADNPTTATETARKLIDAGVTAVEISATTPGFLDVIEAVANDGLIGAGTVLDAETARQAILSGAQFLVAPSLNEDVIRMAHRYGVAVIPGAQTPTEIVAAMSAGADAVKLYPASAANPAVLKDLLAPLPHVPFVPTGGVTPENAAEWIAAGAIAVGLGGALSKASAGEIQELLGALK
jgi:2-dehydro-3-deoxyphosphogluconate aldolase/(4S)-4-hydroxy-2-oxoglutarate aldolase